MAGLTAVEAMRKRRESNYIPEKGEAYVDDDGELQPGWLSDAVLTEMFAKHKFNNEQKRMIRQTNRLIKQGDGQRMVMINFPATTRLRSGKVVYAPQKAAIRDAVPVAMTISKDGNILYGLMSVTKLQENIKKRAQSKRGKQLYSGNIDLILRDTQAMMDFHKKGEDSINYFNDKYGAVEGDKRKKFINTMFGLLNKKEQAVLNPMLLEDGIKSKDNVYRTYRADRVSKAVPMAPEEYAAMPFSYEAVSQVRMPEAQRAMPEGEQAPTRFMPEQLDSDYMKAVESGDVESQQRMVDKLANSRLAQSRIQKINTDGGILETTISSPNKIIIEELYSDDIRSKWGISTIRQLIKIADETGVTLEAIADQDTSMGLDRLIRLYESVGFKKAGFLKYRRKPSLITRDDSGNVIPLSKRFDVGSRDMRFMPEGDVKSKMDNMLANPPEVPKDLQEAWDIGAKTQGLSDIEAVYSGQVPDWVFNSGNDVNQFYEAGRRGENPEYIVGWRRGKIPESGRSKNYADNSMESGVSLAYAHNRTDMETSPMTMIGVSDRKKTYVSGWAFPKSQWGSDGEIVVLAAEEFNPASSDIRYMPEGDKATSAERNTKKPKKKSTAKGDASAIANAAKLK
jgi:hypothetical protein